MTIFCDTVKLRNELNQCKKQNEILLKDNATCQNQVTLLDKNYSECLTKLGEAEAKLKPDFEVSEAPIFGSAWVRAVLADNLSNYPGGVSWWQMDDEYRAATEEEIVKFILWDDADQYPYIKEKRDCDDFMWIFFARFRWFLGRNNCFGTIDWSGGHAYIIFLLRSGGMWIYEIQNDKWWVAGEHGFQQPYPLEHIGLVG